MHSKKEILTSTVSTSTELCFDKNEFMKKNFSVDEFLHKNRNVPSLELLRDNLGVYLKVLRSSMIDLINEDYADFVSLSANLVGLDQSIETIRKPLEAFREDILSIKELINHNEQEVREFLKQKDDLRILKRNLQSLKAVFETMKKLDELLANKLEGNSIKAVDLERAALELIQLKFNKQFCEEYLKVEQQQKIENLNENVLKKLRLFFCSAVKNATSTATEGLERCLRIYITLDACADAEVAFKEDVVGPYMTDTISEYFLQNCPQGLAGIYSKVLNFISLHMTDLLRITQYSDKLKGFNFLVNSFWSDVEQRIENHMSSIFAPGNSEVFFIKYKCSRDFIKKIEEIINNEEALEYFRNHPQTESFQNRWNLPVYFQICFQDIAGEFEAVLEPVLDDKKICESDEFQMTPYVAALKAINRCWSDGIFLMEVFPKFFKLTIQIILRLSQWISDAVEFINRKNFALKVSKISLLISMYANTVKFIEKLPYVLDLLSSNIPDNNEILNAAINDAQQTLQYQLSGIEKAIIEILTVESIECLQQVSDIPRLYRKTNRGVPNHSSAYVEQMLAPIVAFHREFDGNLNSSFVRGILLEAVSRITQEYYISVMDVLTSVQKTEESLRRLRNLKEKTIGQQQLSQLQIPVPAGKLSSSFPSDDDKIRLQLQVDATAWSDELFKMDFTPNEIKKLMELNDFIEETIKAKDMQS